MGAHQRMLVEVAVEGLDLAPADRPRDVAHHPAVPAGKVADGKGGDIGGDHALEAVTPWRAKDPSEALASVMAPRQSSADLRSRLRRAAALRRPPFSWHLFTSR
jgi:hypothetical protein